MHNLHSPHPGRRAGLFWLPVVSLAAGLSATPAMAHIIPVDFGGASKTPFDGSIAVTTTEKNNGASGQYGWIDGADADWGDTHKLATYTFTITGHAADATLTVRAKSNALGGTGLIPGFTLFSGAPAYGAQLNHDYSIGSEIIRDQACAATPGCTSTEGSWRPLTSFAITTDADPTGTNPNVFTYVGHAYDGAGVKIPAANSPTGAEWLVPGFDGSADRSVTATFLNLQPGAYIVFVGGAIYDNQSSTANNASRGMGATLSLAPSAVPVPGAVWLFGSALAGLIGLRRKG